MPRIPFKGLLELHLRTFAPAIEMQRAQLKAVDDFILRAMELEHCRQAHINLIGSESRASQPVMAASAYVGYTQTVEGTPDHRYFPACEAINTVETEGLSRAGSLLGFSAGNMQPNSATHANQAVYEAVLKPGDTIARMKGPDGGHISHGIDGSLAHRHFKIESYGVPSFGQLLDLDQFEAAIKKVRPKLIIIGASSYPRELPCDQIAALAKAYGALLLADISHPAGLVAAGVHKPVKSADFCTFSTHKTMLGPRAGVILCQPEFQAKIDRAVFPGIQGALFPHMMAAKAVCLAYAGTQEFRDIQATIVENAKTLAAVFAEHDLPMYTGGTDSHLLLVRKDPALDSRSDVARLQNIGILTNANYVHGDSPRSGLMSGIRMGTTWITQIGFKPRHTAELGHVLVEALRSDGDQNQHLHRRLERIVEDVLGDSGPKEP